jgi:hypothetical protein
LLTGQNKNIMNKFKLLLLFVSVVSLSFAQSSPRLQVKGESSGINIAIDYGAGLEKYGKVWRAGANENTTISFDKNVSINNVILPAGKYGFFIIPNETGDWTVIFNKKNDGWGAYSYNQEEDALRVNITPSFVEDIQEQLQYSVGKNTIDFAWEKARLEIAFEPTQE